MSHLKRLKMIQVNRGANLLLYSGLDINFNNAMKMAEEVDIDHFNISRERFGAMIMQVIKGNSGYADDEGNG